MTRPQISSAQIAMAAGGLAALLILGALIFEYGFGYAPCDLCMWQRWPHYGAIVAGLIGGFAVWRGLLPARAGLWLAACAVLLVGLSGAIGVYHAGVEWHFWAGPAGCTGNAFHYAGGALDLSARGPMCDVAAWRLFGISMAGYNALISLPAALFAAWLLLRAGNGTMTS